MYISSKPPHKCICLIFDSALIPSSYPLCLSNIFLVLALARRNTTESKSKCLRRGKVGMFLDFTYGSKKTLSWAIDYLLKEGDYLIVIHVFHSLFFDDHHGICDSLESGSALIPLPDYRKPEVKSYGVQVNMEVVNMLDAIPREKMVRVAAKIYWGHDVRKKLCQAVEDLKLNSIVMGNRTLPPIERFALDVYSNYDFQYLYVLTNRAAQKVRRSPLARSVVDRAVNEPARLRLTELS